jgi:hypothetical protein
MVRRTRRWRAPPPKVLSRPTSKHTELCYAFEGKAHIFGPLNGERRTRWVNSRPDASLIYPVNEDVDGWHILGWRLPSGELRHGEHDVVDPELADINRLPRPNTERYLGHSCGAFGPEDPSRPDRP